MYEECQRFLKIFATRQIADVSIGIVEKHVPWAIPLLFHPPEATLVQNQTFDFVAVLPRLRRALTMNTTVNLQQAKISFAEKGEKRKSMKRIFHVMQMNIWAHQIAVHGCLPDRNSGNRHYFTMLNYLKDSEERFTPSNAEKNRRHWVEFEAVWRPIMIDLEAQFVVSVTGYLSFEREYAQRNGGAGLGAKLLRDFHPSGSGLCVIDYLNQCGRLEDLERNLSISVSPHPKLPERLFHLRFNRETSPLESKMTVECNSLIVEKISSSEGAKPQFRAVAFPFPRFFSSVHTEAAVLDLKQTHNVQFQEWVDGRLCMLYSVDGVWHVGSSRCAAGSTLLPVAKTSLADAFWVEFKSRNYRLPKPQNRCFIFELALRDDPVVMHYAENRLIFLGASCILFAFRT